MAARKVLQISDGLTIGELVSKADISRELNPAFEQLRQEAFDMAQKVFAERTLGYNVDHPCYEEMVYGPISLASEVFKRARRLAALLTPIRQDKIRPADLNRVLDICIDLINYLTWMYALVKLASSYVGHADSDDSPNYIGRPAASDPQPQILVDDGFPG